MTSAKKASPRDQGESPFSVLLAELIDAVPFTLGAAIFDSEGETVDYAGSIEPFELRVAAATFQLVLGELRDCPTLHSSKEIAFDAGKLGYLLRVFEEGYGLLLVLRRIGTFVVSRRALAEVEANILEEAGLGSPGAPAWFRVDVEATERWRPQRIRPRKSKSGSAEWLEIEVLGSVMGLAPRERGFRVRLKGGAEVTLVRERPHLWFVDERLDPESHGAEPSRARAEFLAKAGAR